MLILVLRKVIKQLLQSRVKYEEAVKAMDPADRAFYRQTESTDMFTAFYQSQRSVSSHSFITYVHSHSTRKDGIGLHCIEVTIRLFTILYCGLLDNWEMHCDSQVTTCTHKM